MDFDLYMNRPLTESLAVELAAGAVTATVACFGARLLSSEKDGKRELSPGRTLVVAGARNSGEAQRLKNRLGSVREEIEAVLLP